ncbi:hypothetical protein B0H19DRAFT_1374742 [Mycena capillaripes]|nr:hypothetical protein B0H19DRAFT_1374742 [Mycena capillaripes]
MAPPYAIPLPVSSRPARATRSPVPSIPYATHLGLPPAVVTVRRHPSNGCRARPVDQFFPQATARQTTAATASTETFISDAIHLPACLTFLLAPNRRVKRRAKVEIPTLPVETAATAVPSPVPSRQGFGKKKNGRQIDGRCRHGNGWQPYTHYAPTSIAPHYVLHDAPARPMLLRRYHPAMKASRPPLTPRLSTPSPRSSMPCTSSARSMLNVARALIAVLGSVAALIHTAALIHANAAFIHPFAFSSNSLPGHYLHLATPPPSHPVATLLHHNPTA